MKCYKKYITRVMVLILCLSFFVSTLGYTNQSGMSNDMMYEDALMALQLKDYMKASDMFYQLGTYKHSKDYWMYAWALLYLEREEYDMAIQSFDILAKSEFEDCDKYVKYTKGRKAEAENNNEVAIEFYTGLSFLDSNERLLLLVQALPSESPTPEPTPTITPIQLNEEGPIVREMQAQLIHKNYLYHSATGFFDMSTKNAVENVQKDYNLPVTGIYDEATKNELAENDGRYFAVPFNTPYIIYENYKLFKNDDIFSLEIWIKNISSSTFEKTYIKFETIDSAGNIISAKNHTEDDINSGETRGGILDLKDINFYGAVEINIEILSVEYKDNQVIDINDRVNIMIPVDYRIAPTPSPTPSPTPKPTPTPTPVPTSKPTPTPIPTPTTTPKPAIIQIAAGDGYSFALLANGDLYAWGDNTYGQLGDGTNIEKNTPVFIGTGFTQIVAGDSHSLALKGNSLYAWGSNWAGQLGDGTNTDKNTPVFIGTGFTQIAAGWGHSLALKDSSLYAWGNNGQYSGWNFGGQLGDGTNISRNTPVFIGSNFTQVAAGGYHSFALKGDSLYAWGYNEFGQLGDRTKINRYIPFSIGSGYTQITAGYYHSLALKGSSLYTWGANWDGPLGDGTNIDKNFPVFIGINFTQIDAGGRHSFALKGNKLYAWGNNEGGQLGDGTNINRTSPEFIGAGFTQIFAGGWHSLALKGNSLYAWGSNWAGQLGDGTNIDRNVPTSVTFFD